MKPDIKLSSDRQTVDHGASLEEAISRVRKAQDLYATYAQDEVDRVFLAAAKAADRARILLAKLAVEETGMGVFEDKVIKNHFAAEAISNAYRHIKTCGVIEEDPAYGIQRIAAPVGVIAAVIPTTNPTSTTIFKCLLALKTRNAIIISPHPRAKASTIAAARLMLEAAVAAGAPEGIIDWVPEPSPELTQALMKKSDLILATGGPGLVRAAYSSGKPAIGVGAGNTPVILDETADIVLAVNSIIHSKTFDNGMICASEQSVLVPDELYDRVRQEFLDRGCHFLSDEESDRVRELLLRDGGMNPAVVGQAAVRVAEMAQVSVSSRSKLLIAEVSRVDDGEPFAREKLTPVLAMYRTTGFDDALGKAERLINDSGRGHTAVIYADAETAKSRIDVFADRMKAGRILVNTPAAQGGIGDLYNFALPPSLTLGCGSWGGNSISENVGVHHLLNIKTVAERRENMLWFRTPDKIYLKRGCLPLALQELRDLHSSKRVFVVTDEFLYKNGLARPLTDRLAELGIEFTVYASVMPDPTLACARDGARQMVAFEPDTIIAFGGGSAMDAAKIMWLLYEHPDTDFSDMAMRFLDIRKRVFVYPAMGKHAYFVAIPTSAGTGSEVTPFAVITDEDGIKYPLADYSLMPNMAIVDSDLHRSAPRALTAAAGIDALTHALEAYASMLATDYTDALAVQALRIIFSDLERAYKNGECDMDAREHLANAATMAGLAFANAFLGICHSMAHKLGAFHHLPHGVANALMIEETMRFNAAEIPTKMGTFPQYTHPHMLHRYAVLAEQLGIDGKSDKERLEGLIAAIRDLRGRVGIHDSIHEYGVSEQDFLATLDDMAEQAFDDQCTGANPRYPLLSEIRHMYRNAYSGHHTEVE